MKGGVVQTTQQARQSSGSAAAGLWGAVAAIGLVAIVAGLLAMIAGGERTGFLVDESAIDAPAQPLTPLDGLSGLPGDTPDTSANDSSNAASESAAEPFEPFDGQVIPPSVTRDMAQRSLDVADQVTIEVDGKDLTITRTSGGFCQFVGPSGKGLTIAPAGVPGTVPAGVGEADFLVPDPNGPYSGIRIDENGDVVPVPRGEETPDTLQFGFSDDGLRTLELPGTSGPTGPERLRITPDGPVGIGEAQSDLRASPVERLAPDVRRDALQGRLDSSGLAELFTDAGAVEVIRRPDGTIELVGPSGRSTFLSPETVDASSSLGTGGNVFAPSPDGPISGFRIDENGDIVPVPRGSETPDMFAFGFGPTGVRDLYLPNSDGEALRVSPNGQRSTESALGHRLSDGAWVPSPAPETQEGADPSTLPADSATGEVALPVADGETSGRPWWPILLVSVGIGLLLLGAVLALDAWRKRVGDELLTEPEPAPGPPDMDQIVERVHDKLDGDVDPRTAILQAYSEFESGLAARSLVRSKAETPRAFLQRTVGTNPDTAGPLGRLTDLFELARFSDYPVTNDMRNDAIAAVDQIRRAEATEPQLL